MNKERFPAAGERFTAAKGLTDVESSRAAIGSGDLSLETAEHLAGGHLVAASGVHHRLPRDSHTGSAVRVGEIALYTRSRQCHDVRVAGKDSVPKSGRW